MALGKKIVPQSVRYARWGWLFITPWIIGFLCFTLGPMLASLFLSFTEYNGRNNPVWIGLGNYAKLFKDPNILLRAITIAH